MPLSVLLVVCVRAHARTWINSGLQAYICMTCVHAVCLELLPILQSDLVRVCMVSYSETIHGSVVVGLGTAALRLGRGLLYRAESADDITAAAAGSLRVTASIFRRDHSHAHEPFSATGTE